MFEIKFVIRDKHLADVLRSVQGIAIEPPVVLPLEEGGVRFVKTAPVTEAAVASPLPHKIKVSEGGPKATDVAKEWLDKNPKVVRFVPEMIVPALVAHGFHKNSVYYVIQEIIKEGRLKKKPGRGQYEVINASTKHKSSK